MARPMCAAGQVDDVVPVAADLVARRQVARRGVDADEVGDAVGQEAALQRDRAAMLAIEGVEEARAVDRGRRLRGGELEQRGVGVGELARRDRADVQHAERPRPRRAAGRRAASARPSCAGSGSGSRRGRRRRCRSACGPPRCGPRSPRRPGSARRARPPPRGPWRRARRAPGRRRRGAGWRRCRRRGCPSRASAARRAAARAPARRAPGPRAGRRARAGPVDASRRGSSAMPEEDLAAPGGQGWLGVPTEGYSTGRARAGVKVREAAAAVEACYYLEGMERVELHFHLLPGVDDGPPDLGDALALAREAVRDGTRLVTCTPHAAFVDVAEIPERVRELRAALSQAGIDLEVRPRRRALVGRRARARRRRARDGRPGPARPALAAARGAAAGHRHARGPATTARAELRERGFGVLIGHPERSPALADAPGAVEDLLAAGDRAAGQRLLAHRLARPRARGRGARARRARAAPRSSPPMPICPAIARRA